MKLSDLDKAHALHTELLRFKRHRGMILSNLVVSIGIGSHTDLAPEDAYIWGATGKSTYPMEDDLRARLKKAMVEWCDYHINVTEAALTSLSVDLENVP